MAECAIAVGPATETGTGTEQPLPADNTNLLYGILAGVVVAIVLAAVAVMLVLRKK